MLAITEKNLNIAVSHCVAVNHLLDFTMDYVWNSALSLVLQAASGHSERMNGGVGVTQFKRPEHSCTELMKEILWRLATKQLRSGEWKKLAHHWGFTENHVKAIEHQYTGGGIRNGTNVTMTSDNQQY